MELKIAVYNMNWMSRLFDSKGELKTTGTHAERSKKLARIVKRIKPDILGIVEGPDTTVSGSKTASKQLEKWVAANGLNPNYKGVHGSPSRGRQELCALYLSNKVKVKFKPENSKSKPPFNEPFLVGTTDPKIKEQYEHWRSPLELQVTKPGSNKELARIIVAHTKSKGIFESVDMARYQQLSERNRKKLYAECMSIRARCDRWLEEDPARKIIVMGDINDGAGMDHFERHFHKSAVEILMGDIWAPELVLCSVLPKPEIKADGWVPYTSDFKDTITKYTVNVLIDHILVSQNVAIGEPIVWNPELKENEDNQDVQDLKDDLKTASDHYPVSITVDL